ncbi:Rossmann-like and DUF2520 domain-containing protein [Lutimonas sp.]|uniref:Rossmann-like and DUF2520 domain-containing protein n=1 Tax=Lutimonas sp. TaxID=1872403 RepID=UPI003D9B0B07
MIKVVLIGDGNVAYQLAIALQSANNVDLIQRYSRSESNNSLFDPSIDHTTDLKHLKHADIYILAVKDEAIAEVAALIPDLNGIVVHTSGAMGLEQLGRHQRIGVIYPVQSLSIQQKINLKKVPFAIEASSKEDLDVIRTLISHISEHVFDLDSAKREKLHITAVFANNFSNFMFSCAEDLCQQFDIPFDILRPLIVETGKKIQYLDPLEAQTGPAKRLDHEVIQKHKKELKGMQKEIYTLLTEAIIKTYQKNNHGKKL